jgi:tryptophan synthase alpha subunit
MESFRQAANSPEFIESGRDAMEMGVPFSVHFAEVSE